MTLTLITHIFNSNRKETTNRNKNININKIENINPNKIINTVFKILIRKTVFKIISKSILIKMSRLNRMMMLIVRRTVDNCIRTNTKKNMNNIDSIACLFGNRV